MRASELRLQAERSTRNREYVPVIFRLLAVGSSETGASGSVVVVEVGTKDSAYRAFTEHNDLVEARTPNGANYPFYVSSLLG